MVSLGTDMIKTLVISDSVFQTFNSFPHSGSTDLRAFWKNSLTAAVMARDLARRIDYPQLEEAYLAGLLHNVGRLALLATAPKEYAFNFTARDDEDLCAVEQRTLQITHAEAGAWLIERWQLDSFLADSRAVPPRAERAPGSGASLDPHRAPGAPAVPAMPDDDGARRRGARAVRPASRTRWTRSLGRAARQVEKAAIHLGIDLAGADDIPAPPAYAPPPPVDPVQQRLSEEVRNLVLVSEVGQTFARQQGESGLLEAMTRSARILFDFDNAVVLLENPTGQALVGAPTGEPAAHRRILDPAGEGRRRRAGRAGPPPGLRRAATAARSAWRKNSCCACSARESLVCLPLVAGARCLGVLVGGVAGLAGCRRARSASASCRRSARRPPARWRRRCRERGHARRQLAHVAEEYREASRRVVHEVNNPLSIIKNYLSVLDSKLASARSR